MSSEKMLPPLSGLILEEQTELTLSELSRACAVQADFIIELVEEGVLTPLGQAPEHWRFTGVHLSHVKITLRLQRDLGVNLAGAALALQLLAEIDTLRAQLKSLDGSI